jgi:protein gp37
MEAGKRVKVFCGSMCDIFDPEGPRAERDRLLELIEGTANLFWLLLTKRPENIGDMMPPLGFTPNVGLGVTVETQEQTWRIGEMLRHKAALYFVSIEPALGALDLVRSNPIPGYGYGFTNPLQGAHQIITKTVRRGPTIDWVICGAETGPGARPMNPHWARRLRDQCIAAGVPFFLKNCDNIKRPGSRLLDGREWNEFPSCIDRI